MEYKIGVSLAPDLLMGTPNEECHKELLKHFGNISNLLFEISERGANYIEVRSFLPITDKEKIEKTIFPIVNNNLNFSVHTRLEEINAENFVESFKYVSSLKPISQKKINLTVHNLVKSKNVDENSILTSKYLKKFANSSEQLDLNFNFALENMRKKQLYPAVGDCDEILKIIERLEIGNVGICWDMGHFYYNSINETETIEKIPSANFLSRVIHTHIHGLTNNTTHYPLTEENIPLLMYINSLKKAKYKGIYNLELEFQRFFEKENSADALLNSIETLKNVLKR